ncbi:MAG: methyl-accepting chemotaxis protein [Magnetospirillum sp.]
MFQINDLPISQKFGLVTKVLFGGMAVILVAGIGTAFSIRHSVNVLNETAFGSFQQAASVESQFTKFHAGLYQLTSFSANERDKAQVTKMAEKLTADLARLRPLAASFEDMAQDAMPYLDAARDVIEMAPISPSIALSSMKRVDQKYQVIQDLSHNRTQQADQYRQDAFSGTMTAMSIGGLSMIVIALAVAGGMAWIARKSGDAISTPIKSLTQALTAIADGDLQAEIPGGQRKDEIGVMARAIRGLKDGVEERNAERDAKEQRSAFVDAQSSQFETKVSGMLNMLDQSAQKLLSISQAMQQTTSQAVGLSESVNKSAAHATRDVNAVAATAEELAASINEINRHVVHSAEMTRSAAAGAQDAQGAVSSLVQAAQEIGEVVSMIMIIAKKTNLLALNASIEAARAGEAGRGFAVVADEVKQLADQTARATTEVDDKIRQVQSRTQSAAKAITDILGVVDQLQGISAEISSAVDQQRAATAEIARTVQNVATNTAVIATDIQQVEDAIRSSGTVSHDVLQSANTMTDNADLLQGSVHAFLGVIKSDTDSSPDLTDHFLSRVVQTAKSIEAIFQTALGDGRLGHDDVFDENYVLVPGTDPQQFTTRFTAFTDQHLSALQDGLAQEDDRVLFCACVDRNGYLPTHNSQFSAPQGDDAEWNKAHCRNRRFFDDPTGLAAARNTKPTMIQAYRRDMGHGGTQMMMDISAPIFIDGQHWGALRMGLRKD